MTHDLIPVAELSPTHRKALARAVVALENPNFAGRVSDYAGKPVNRILELMPGAASSKLSGIVEGAIQQCLKVAIESLDDIPPPSAPWLSSTMAGISGAIGGVFGLAGLPIELPVTTVLMLRAIADIARREGEDLSSIGARLACLEVFALGAQRSRNRTDIGYYAARAMLTRLTSDAAALIMERGLAGATAPAVNGLLVEVASRFGIVVSDKVAASALPALGALGGAAINALFMDHFQRIAEAHFTIRRLERIYGIDVVQKHYADLIASPARRAV